MDQTITLITGANSGIGLELASQLLATASNTVILCSRSRERGEAAVEDLEARGLPGALDLVMLDVTDEDSIRAAAKQVREKYGRLDALVNNAGISTPQDTSLFRGMEKCFRVHAMGPAAMGEAFAPLLLLPTTTTTSPHPKADADADADAGADAHSGTVQRRRRVPRIINVTSGAGSIALDVSTVVGAVHVPRNIVPYRVSKAAMNMLTACQAAEYGRAGCEVFAFNPGFTVSNLSAVCTLANGAQPTRQPAAAMVDILLGKRDGEHGGFLSIQGQEAW